MKMFVISMGLATQEQRDTITRRYQDTAYGYWHWLPDFWILQSPYDNDTAAAIRSQIHNLVPNIPLIVLQVDPVEDQWATYGGPKWREWLDRNWKKQKP